MKANQLATLLGCITATMLLSDATWAQITADVVEGVRQDLPSAKKVIADYHEATGGEKNHRAIKSLVSNGSIKLSVKGNVPAEMREITGEISLKQMAPNKLRLTTNFERIGTQIQGYDGETAWLISGEGPQIQSGDQMKMAKLQASMNQYLHLSDHYSRVECTGEEEFNGEACFVVQASNQDDRIPMKAFFSKESKLLVGTTFTMEIQNELTEISNLISDYRPVGDVKMSFKSVSENPYYTQVFAVENIAINSKVNESDFDLPEAIQELLDQE